MAINLATLKELSTPFDLGTSGFIVIGPWRVVAANVFIAGAKAYGVAV